MKSTILKAVVLGVSLATSSVFAATTPDSLITAKAKLALWTSDVRSRTVHIDTNDGVLTLSGKVPTAEQKAMAEKKARQIEGVRDVKSFLQIVPAAEEKMVERSDKQLKEAVKTAFDNDASLKNSQITIKDVSKGVVMLGGEAKTLSDQLRAVALADRTPGVKRVTSEVKAPKNFTREDRIEFTRADGPAGTMPRSPDDRGTVEDPTIARRGPSDTGITTSVKMRLFTTPEIPSTEIHVDTENQVVTLFGMVPSDEVKRVAEAEAMRVKGVASVENRLEVVPSAQKDAIEMKDDDLSSALKLAFKDRKEFKNINTEVKNGVVQLTGRVDSMNDEFNAVRAARSVKGVRNVVDQLKVEEKNTGDRSGT